MGYHVYINLGNLPISNCPAREMLESIRKTIDDDRPIKYYPDKSDIRECFTCISIETIDTDGFSEDLQKKKFVLSCLEKKERIPIVVE